MIKTDGYNKLSNRFVVITKDALICYHNKL